MATGTIIQIIHKNTHLIGMETEETFKLFNGTPFQQAHDQIITNLFSLNRNAGESFQDFLQRASNHFASLINNYRNQALALLPPIPVGTIDPYDELRNRLNGRITLGVIQFIWKSGNMLMTVHTQYLGCPSNPTPIKDSSITYARVEPRVVKKFGAFIEYTHPKGLLEFTTPIEPLIDCAKRQLCDGSGLSGVNINLVETSNTLNLGSPRTFRVFRQIIDDTLKAQFDTIITAKNNSAFAKIHNLEFRPNDTWYNLPVPPAPAAGAPTGGYYNKYQKYKTKYLELKEKLEKN